MVGERTIQNAPAATLTRLAERDSGHRQARRQGGTIGRSRQAARLQRRAAGAHPAPLTSPGPVRTLRPLFAAGSTGCR